MFNIYVLLNDSDADLDPLTIVSVGQPAHGTVTITTRSNPHASYLVFAPERGYVGEVTFPYTIDDGKGGQASSTVTVQTKLSAPFSTIIAENGGPVPGEQDGAKFVRFGPPGLDGDQPFYRGFFKRPDSSRLLQGVFGTVSGSPFQVVTGDEAPGIEGASFLSFADPVAWNGFAFLAKLKGPGIKATHDESLWSTNQPEAPGTLTLVAREGDLAPGVETNVTIQTIVSYGMNFEGRLQWLIKLKHVGQDITAKNDLVLYESTDSGPQVIMRDGVLIKAGGVTRRVKSFNFFNAPAQSNGDGRSGYGRILLLNFEGNTQALASWFPDSGLFIQCFTGQEPLDAPAIRLGPFYLPASGGFGDDLTFRSKIRTGFASASNGEGIFTVTAGEITPWYLTGDPLFEGAPLQFSSFSDPVTGLGVMAFRAKITGPGYNASNNEMLFWASNLDPKAFGIAGGRGQNSGQGALISRFHGMAVPFIESPNGRGPVFTAWLKGRGVTRKNDFSLSAVASSGSTVLLARTGSPILDTETRRLARIGAFTAVPKSLTQRRTVSSSKQVIYLATFTDAKQAIVRVEVP